jgi:hypothetical protein
MKKRDPRVVKGENAEARFIALTRSLRKLYPWIQKVRKAGRRLDDAGVDVTVHILSENGSLVRVPFQVKSSRYHTHRFIEKHPECVALGVPIVLVNDLQPDEVIQYQIRRELEGVRGTRKDFEVLYRAIANRPHGYGPRSRGKWYRHLVLQEAMERNHRGEQDE